MNGINGWNGLTLALLAGVVMGSVLVPMKLIKSWAWESVWLVYSLCAYLVCPWVVAWFTIPHLASVYGQAGWQVSIITFCLGAGWGLAVVLFGIAVDVVGLAISTALLFGSSVALGSIGALCLVDASKLRSPEGLRIVAWDMVLLLGVLLCAQAGRTRQPAATSDGQRTRRGILIALVAGILSTLFNIVLTYGAPIQRQAVTLGADSNLAANAIWSLAVTGGSLPSIFWTIHLLRKNSTWKLYKQAPDSLKNVWLCIGMGVAWISGTVLYGISTTQLGKFGTALGWPIYMSATILVGIGWGWKAGEWRGAPPRAVRLLWAGVAVQILSIVLLSIAA
jgi:L-rhamnose-H+ transport protein